MVGLYEYQIRILKEDMGSMFVPMFFYNQELDGRVETIIRYDLSDHISLEEWLTLNDYSLVDVLDALENIALLLDKCKEVLINYENLEIKASNIFVSTKNKKEIKLQYIPKKESEDDFRFNKLVSEIEIKIIKSDIKEYLQIILEKLETEKPNIMKIINLIGQVKREVYICGWIGNSRTL